MNVPWHTKSLVAHGHILKDLRGIEQLFDCPLILLAGNFRQTLPDIPRSKPVGEINVKTNTRIQLLHN